MGRLVCKIVMIAAVLRGAGAAAAAQGVIFVDAAAPPNGDGRSWSTAFRDLQDGLDAARGDPNRTALWVADGTYRPDRGTGNRDTSFALVAGVTVYGGFRGDENQLEQRDPNANRTVLSGDLLGNDQPGFVNYADNARHVATASSTRPAAVLDGLTLRGGNGDFEGELLLGGGAVFVQDGDCIVRGCTFTENSVGLDEPTLGNFGGAVYLKTAGSLTITDSAFVRNRGNGGGAIGSLLDNGGSVTLTRCRFERNTSPHQTGGAIYLAYGEHRLLGCDFVDNMGQYGGALFGVLASRLDIRGCQFARNEALVRGGGMWLDRCDENDATPVVIHDCDFVGNITRGDFGGAIRADETLLLVSSSRFLGNQALRPGSGQGGAIGIVFEVGHQIVNCEFSGNHALATGGLALSRAGAQVVNSTFANNTSEQAFAGAGLSLDSATADVSNAVFWGNRAGGIGGEFGQIGVRSSALQLNYSLVEGLTGAFGGQGNIDADPRLVNSLGVDGTAGTPDDDLRLGGGSAAIDAADNRAVPPDVLDLDGDGSTSEPTPFDATGRDRFVDDPATTDTGVGPPPVVDMGAHEFQPDGRGDLNCDGLVDFGDINPFVLALSDPEEYNRQFPDCHLLNGDCNSDGRVDFGDINPFVELLSGVRPADHGDEHAHLVPDRATTG